MRPASSVAATQSGCVSDIPPGAEVKIPMRRLPGSVVTALAYEPCRLGAAYGSPATAPAITSRSAPESRTLRVRTPRITKPFQGSPSSGPSEMRPRLALSPTKPLALAGMRIDPPPSPAWPTATIPAATAAPDPPDDPPGPCARLHGLCVGPYASGSVVGCRPNSGVLVLPIAIIPAARIFAMSVLSVGAM
ncbi:unannotated protein [freshwater metagenome]|uniref:Unannotated protein n=1 Tax=freshwater metagenome TaxID=449393 RepID=A0A6J7MX95_9ZZZZ